MRYRLKIKSNDLFRQNTTYTTISIPVWLHVSVPFLDHPQANTFNIKRYYLYALYIMESQTVYRMCVKTIIKVI